MDENEWWWMWWNGTKQKEKRKIQNWNEIVQEFCSFLMNDIEQNDRIVSKFNAEQVDF